MAALLMDDAVHRLNPLDRHLAPQVVAAIGENLGQNARVKEEGRANVEGETFFLDGAGTSTNARLALDQGDIIAAALQNHGGCKPAGACANNNDARSGRSHVLLFL
jgi:hypothetical protein